MIKHVKREVNSILKKSIVLASTIVAMGFGALSTKAEDAVILTTNELINRPFGTGTLNYLNGKSLKINESTTYDFEDTESIYELTQTNLTGANIITNSTYDATTKTVSNSNYAINLDPSINDPSGTESFINGVNGGNFPITYEKLGKQYVNTEGKPISVSGYFQGLSAKQGSAFLNQGKIGLLQIFAMKNNATAFGGALANTNEIQNLVGTFIGNSCTSSTYGGGAIINVNSKGKINNIIGDFIGNTTNGEGGAIYNYSYSTINYIIGDFIGNIAESNGGAISNTAGNKIGTIIGDFIGNKSNNSYGGGAIFNYDSTIDTITGNFIDNKAKWGGGAILNYKATIHNIEGNFINNDRDAIKNYVGGRIDSIKGNFINNSNTAILNKYDTYKTSIGSIDGNFIGNQNGAILNFGGFIDEINGTFINNHSEGNSMIGTISNAYELFVTGVPGGTIKKITGTFINNYIDAQNTFREGAAIFNAATLNEISGIFEGNHIINGDSGRGGAIVSSQDLYIVNSKFTNNYVQVNRNSATGGAIHANGNALLEANGGYNFEFKGNYVEDPKGNKTYEAIYMGKHEFFDADNNKTLIPTTLTLNAIENSTFTFTDRIEGCEHNIILKSDDGTGIINFINNYTDENNNEVKTIASFNNAKVSVNNVTVNLDYKDKELTTYTPTSLNIDSDSTVNLSLDIKAANNGSSDTIEISEASSGFVTINSINFIDSLDKNDSITVRVLKTDSDTLQLKLSDTLGKAIDNSTRKIIVSSTLSDSMDSIVIDANVDVISNDQFKTCAISNEIYNTVSLATSPGGTTNDSLKIVYGLTESVVENEGKIAGDTLTLWNQSIQADPTITKTINLTENYKILDSSTGLGTSKGNTLTVNGVSTGSNVDMNQKTGFVVKNGTTLNINNVTFTNLNNNSDGTLISNSGTINLSNVTIGDVDKTYTKSAILNNANLNFIDGSSTINRGITGSGTITISDELIANAQIFQSLIVIDDNGKLTIGNSNTDEKPTNNQYLILKTDNLINKGRLDTNGNIYINQIQNDNGIISTRNSTFNLTNITSNSSGTILLDSTVFNPANLVENQTISAKNSTLNIAHNPYLMVNNSIKLDNSTINIGDLSTQNLVFNDLTLINRSIINIKSSIVDYKKETIGKIVSSNSPILASENSVINLGSLKIVNLSNKPIPNGVMRLNFIDSKLARNVNYTGEKDTLTPIWKLGLDYDHNTGDFVIVQGGHYNPETKTVDLPQNPSDRFNPAILATPVAAQIGGYLGMLNNYENAFNNIDINMLKPMNKRISAIQANMIASSATASSLNYMTTDENRSSAWFRPFGIYDSIRLKRGPKVYNFTYGSFIGGDSEFVKLHNGFYGVFSPYISYLGSHQSFTGNSVWQNGGTIGATGSLYKGNFFTGLTIGAGASVAEVSNMYGQDSFPMIMAGIASKTGYNIEFKEGKYIIQPSMQISYTMVNAFDYTNAAGIRISTDPMHAIQLMPNLKLIMNTKNNWSPYVLIGMNWNILDKTNFNAEIYELPQMTVRPYFLYGIGVQKTISDKFTGTGQLVLRNGGRNGLGFAFSLRYEIGKEKNNSRLSQKQTKTVLKQLSYMNSSRDFRN